MTAAASTARKRKKLAQKKTREAVTPKSERGEKQVCAARKHHAVGYAAFQGNYKAFVDELSSRRATSCAPLRHRSFWERGENAVTRACVANARLTPLTRNPFS
jgi:hypothetical protein